MRKRVGSFRAVLVAASLGMNACSGSTSVGPPPVALLGTWRYAAVQVAPAASSISGVLIVSTQAGSTFDGSLDAIETRPDGSSRRLLGSVHGRALDASTLDFDIVIDVTRRHVAVIQADTAAGNWLAGNVAGSEAGTFRMVHVR